MDQIYHSPNKDSCNFTKKFKSKELITSSSVWTKKSQTWKLFSRKKKITTFSNCKMLRMNKKTIEELIRLKFLNLIKKGLKLNLRLKGFKLSLIHWSRKSNHKLKNFQWTWLTNNLNLSLWEKILKQRCAKLKKNSKKSTETLLKNRKFGKRTESLWKAKSNNKPPPFKNFKRKDTF